MVTIRKPIVITITAVAGWPFIPAPTMDKPIAQNRLRNMSLTIKFIPSRFKGLDFDLDTSGHTSLDVLALLHYQHNFKYFVLYFQTSCLN